MNSVKRIGAVAAAAAIVTGGLLVAGPGTASASCTTFVYQVDAPGGVTEYEADSYSSQAEGWWSQGWFFRGTGGTRSNGWTPIEKYGFSQSGPWYSLLESPSDVHDFVRASGLDYIGCH